MDLVKMVFSRSRVENYYWRVTRHETARRRCGAGRAATGVKNFFRQNLHCKSAPPLSIRFSLGLYILDREGGWGQFSPAYHKTHTSL